MNCPEWAQGCVIPTKLTKEVHPATEIIFNQMKPKRICSFARDNNCDDQVISEIFPQVELLNGSKIVVDHLQVKVSKIRTEQCIGKGQRTGTPEFCKLNGCISFGTQLCYYDEKENAFLASNSSSIPIKSWGYEVKQFYPYKRNNN